MKLTAKTSHSGLTLSKVTSHWGLLQFLLQAAKKASGPTSCFQTLPARGQRLHRSLPPSRGWACRHGCLHRQMSLQNQAQSFRLCCLSYKYQRSQQTNTSPRSLPASSTHIFGFLWEELYNNCLFIHPLTKSINMYWAPTVSKALCWMLGNTQQCVKHSSTVWGLLWGLHVSLFTEHWRR